MRPWRNISSPISAVHSYWVREKIPFQYELLEIPKPPSTRNKSSSKAAFFGTNYEREVRFLAQAPEP